jgi:predicted DNA-binding transcriptional regulator AlpA
MELRDLLTGKEVAESAGLRYKTLWTYKKRNTLPEPDIYIGNKPLWKRETIAEWLSTRRTRATRDN